MRGCKHVFAWAIASWMGVAAVFAQSPSGSIVEYSYDTVGNIVGIQSSSALLSISGFSPASGPAGATIIVSGSGFSTATAGNSVRINGTTTQVVSAARTQLAITVPPGATTGPIAVTVGGNTVGSASAFVVTADYGPPTISSFVPLVATAGSAVSVAGSNFSPTIANDSARIGVAAATIASASSANVVVSVPAGTGSGHIQITTPKGAATSAGFLFIPPGSYPASAVVATAAGAPDVSNTLTINTPGKLALMAFDVSVPRKLGIFVTASTLTNGTLQLLDPARTVIASAPITASGATIPALQLNQSGTYTVAVTAGASNTGSIAIVAGGPDLVVTNSSVGTIVANANGSYGIPVSYTVTNVGSAIAPSRWFDMAYLSTDGVLDNADQHLNGWPVRNIPLAPGASYSVNAIFTTNTATAAGSYTFFVKADGHGPTSGDGTNTDAGSLSELDDANNVRATPITLARPDLVVTNASVGSITRNVNGTYTLSVTFSVQNSGTVTAQPNWYDMAYLSADAVLDNADQQLAGSPRRSAALEPGQSYTATGTFTTVAFTPAGNYTLFIKADGHGPTFGNGTNTDPGDLIEANDANNARGLSITLP